MKSFVFGIIMLLSLSSMAQTIPQWYTDLVERKVGEWVADNVKYKSDSETSEYYTLVWWKGANETDLYGVLKGEEDEVYWNFYQFYDGKNEKAVLIQYGQNGVEGKGELHHVSDTLSVKQAFINTEGLKWEELHQTILIEEGKEQTLNYTIGINGDLKIGRVYEWERQEYIKL